MEKESIEERGIRNVKKSFKWTSNYLKCVGISPVKNYFPLFLFFFTYLTIHCSLTFLQLIFTPKTMESVLANLVEHIEITMTLTKIGIARFHRKTLGKLFTEIKEFSLTEKYETKQEKLTLFNYTKLPVYFIKTVTCTMTLTEVLYYTNGLILGIDAGKENNSMSHHLPYKTLEIIDLSDNRVYICLCVYQTVIVPAIVLGYVGFDCMFVNLSIQVVAQFAILSYKVKTILNSSKNYRQSMRELVLRHYRLIRLAEELENTFNIPIMQQLMGSTMHICISGYYVLTSNESDNTMQLVLFISYVFSVISTLFIYCLIGECFIQESTNFGKAMYEYEWYNLPATDAKFFLICMIRSQKPQCLTSGKFAILSLTVFTDLLKTSMGYLSVLRTFI